MSQSSGLSDFKFDTIGRPPALLQRLSSLAVDHRHASPPQPPPSGAVTANIASNKRTSPLRSSSRERKPSRSKALFSDRSSSPLSSPIGPKPVISNPAAQLAVGSSRLSDAEKSSAMASQVTQSLQTVTPQKQGFLPGNSGTTLSQGNLNIPGAASASDSSAISSGFRSSASVMMSGPSPSCSDASMDIDPTPGPAPSKSERGETLLDSSPSPAEFYTFLAELAQEKAAWDNIQVLRQRCRDEHEELQRRHQETVRAAQREKDQADRAVAAAEAVLDIFESLRAKQERRWAQEKAQAERMAAEVWRRQDDRIKTQPAILRPNATATAQRTQLAKISTGENACPAGGSDLPSSATGVDRAAAAVRADTALTTPVSGERPKSIAAGSEEKRLAGSHSGKKDVVAQDAVTLTVPIEEERSAGPLNGKKDVAPQDAATPTVPTSVTGDAKVPVKLNGEEEERRRAEFAAKRARVMDEKMKANSENAAQIRAQRDRENREALTKARSDKTANDGKAVSAEPPSVSPQSFETTACPLPDLQQKPVDPSAASSNQPRTLPGGRPLSGGVMVGRPPETGLRAVSTTISSPSVVTPTATQPSKSSSSSQPASAIPVPPPTVQPPSQKPIIQRVAPALKATQNGPSAAPEKAAARKTISPPGDQESIKEEPATPAVSHTSSMFASGDGGDSEIQSDGVKREQSLEYDLASPAQLSAKATQASAIAAPGTVSPNLELQPQFPFPAAPEHNGHNRERPRRAPCPSVITDTVLPSPTPQSPVTPVSASTKASILPRPDHTLPAKPFVAQRVPQTQAFSIRTELQPMNAAGGAAEVVAAFTDDPWVMTAGTGRTSPIDYRAPDERSLSPRDRRNLRRDHDHYSPSPPRPVVSRARRHDHYSPTSTSRSPSPGLTRKRPRDNNDAWLANERLSRRPRSRGPENSPPQRALPLPPMSYDSRREWHPRNELVDSIYDRRALDHALNYPRVGSDGYAHRGGFAVEPIPSHFPISSRPPIGTAMEEQGRNQQWPHTVSDRPRGNNFRHRSDQRDVPMQDQTSLPAAPTYSEKPQFGLLSRMSDHRPAQRQPPAMPRGPIAQEGEVEEGPPVRGRPAKDRGNRGRSSRGAPSARGGRGGTSRPLADRLTHMANPLESRLSG